MKNTLTFFIFFLLLVSTKVDACSVITSDRVLIIKNKVLAKDIFVKTKECNTNTIDSIVEIFKSSQGQLTQRSLNHYLSKTGKEEISITPSKVEIQFITSLLRDRYSFSADLDWTDVDLVNNNKTALLLSKKESIAIHCPSCDFPGSKSLQLVIKKTLDSTYKSYLLKGSLKYKSKALVSLSHLNVDNTPLSKNSFKYTTTFIDSPNQVVSRDQDLKFYKINKPIKAGTVLKIGDLAPIQLVKAGSPVTITLKNSSLKLHSKATATQSGHFGEIVRLINSKTRRTIIGKVVDFNKVVVEL